MSNGYFPNSHTHRARPVSKRIPAQSVDQYAIAISTVEWSKQFYGKLKVIRSTDKRIIFPFEGVQDIGPYQSAAEAEAAARHLADRFVQADLKTPE